MSLNCRCGNVAAILELDEHLQREFTIFEAAPQVCNSPFICFPSVDVILHLKKVMDGYKSNQTNIVLSIESVISGNRSIIIFYKNVEN